MARPDPSMFPILQIGPLAIQTSLLALFIGAWVAQSASEREAVRLKLKPDLMYTLTTTGLVAGILGARLIHVIQNASAYLADPFGILTLNPAAFAPTEGLLIGALAAYVYGARKHLTLRTTLDALAPGLGLMMAAIALAHIASGDAFGAPARVPWSTYLWDDYRHPSQVYESIGALVVLVVWWRLRTGGPFAGSNFLLVVALSAAARIFLEAFRGDSLLTVGGLRAAQLWGIVIVAGCIGLAWAWRP